MREKKQFNLGKPIRNLTPIETDKTREQRCQKLTRSTLRVHTHKLVKNGGEHTDLNTLGKEG